MPRYNFVGPRTARQKARAGHRDGSVQYTEGRGGSIVMRVGPDFSGLGGEPAKQHPIRDVTRTISIQHKD